MKRYWFLLPVIACSLLLLASVPTDPILIKITQALDSLQSRYPQEKVYLQLDKDIYYAGEDVWFKGYTVFRNKPTTLSGILYVDLVNENGVVLERKMLPVFGGVSSGNFTLPNNMTAGAYRIMAYTAWMKNFDPAFIFHKDIYIFNDSSTSRIDSLPEIKDDTDYHVQFLPEGGNLVNDLTSFIAFKVVNNYGLPVSISGSVVDGNGQQVNAVKTIHDGMGEFAITPRPGVKYYAVISAFGKQKKLPLPEALSFGVALHIINRQIVDSTSNKISYYVQKNDTTNEYNKLYLVVQMQDRPVDVQEVDFMPQGNYSSVQASGSIDTKNFPEGIAQITLFNGLNGIPLAERLVFIKRSHIPFISLKSTNVSFGSRQKEEFTLSLNSNIGGNYSVAVTDAEQVPREEWCNNIVADLLLTSDIKGFVYHPGWYFKDEKSSTLEAMDLVMLTNGWRRYSWKKILNNQYPDIRYDLERSIVLRGQAFDGNPVKKRYYRNNSFILFSKTPHDADSLDNMISVETDSMGLFSVTGLYFHQSSSLYVMKNERSPNEKKKKKNKKERENISQADVEVVFRKNLVDTMPLQSKIIVPFYNPFLRFSPEQMTTYANQAKEERFYDEKSMANTIELKAITVKAKRLTRTDSMINEYASVPFAGISGRTFDLTKDTYNGIDFADNALDYISEHVPGPVVDGDTKGSPVIYWRLRNGLMMGMNRETLLLNAPDFFLNEQLLNDGPSGYDNAINLLQMVKVADIAMVRVFPPGLLAMAPGNAPHGAIVIYTRQGADVREKSTALDVINLKGYSVTKEFYSPDYNVIANALPDKRTTLYWDPYLVPDTKTHNVNFSFYNNDSCKKFRVIIEGVGRNGEIVHLERLIQP